MATPVLIGLSGKRGSGKNTVGEFIRDWAEENGHKAQLQGFADRLKLSFARIFVPDCTLEEALLFCDTIKNIGGIRHDTLLPREIFDRFGVKNVISGREALQHYGTEAHRDVFGSEFWVDQLLPLGHVSNHPDTHNHSMVSAWSEKWDQVDYAIVTDVRFPNEADRILALGGFMYEVVRPELDNQEDGHASEQKLDSAYMYGFFQNDGSLENLKKLVFEEMNALAGIPEYEEFQKSQLGERTFHGL